MFSVHGVTGQSFHGALEQLNTVPGLSKARRSRGINQEGEELGLEVQSMGSDSIDPKLF